jgi:spermidine synthase
MNYYTEIQPWGSTAYEIVNRSYVGFMSKRQRVEFITNPHFGRMLFLDGVLQSSSSDEKIYHEALVAPGLFIRKPARILIAGGSEGAVAREVLKHDCVKGCVMVDWDSELVAHCRWLEGFNTSAFDDARLKYVCQDISEFCKGILEPFDLAFLDLLDMESEDDLDFVKSLVSILFDKGTGAIVVNVGRNKLLAELLVYYREGSIKQIIVPSFQEPWYLVTLRSTQSLSMESSFLC